MMRRITLALASTLVLLGGCFASQTMVVEYDLIRDGHRGTPIEASAAAFGQAEVDLERVRTYEENRSDIELVDRLGFEADLSSASGSTARLSLYLSQRDDLTDPAREGTVLLRDFVVPASGAQLSYRDSEGRIENVEAFRTAVHDGTFTLYYVTDAPDLVTITDMKLIVTLTVSY